MEDYRFSGLNQLLDKKKQLENEQFEENPNESQLESIELIQTRTFLRFAFLHVVISSFSHKRATAQAIAGRIYEGLKADYRVFLDSEAKFKIHVNTGSSKA